MSICRRLFAMFHPSRVFNLHTLQNEQMKYLILALGILLSSCGATAHLKMAKKHLEKAKQKGAIFSGDTLMKKHVWEHKGPKGGFNVGGVTIQKQDGVIVVDRIKLKDTVIYKDKIKFTIKDNYIEAKCPDEKKEELIPVVVNDISAGYTTWQLIRYLGGSVLVAFVAGWLFGKLNKNYEKTNNIILHDSVNRTDVSNGSERDSG